MSDCGLHYGTHQGTEQEISTRLTLVECLNRHTRAERLEGSKFVCQRCHVPQEPIKQLSYQSMPNVICFQLKVRIEVVNTVLTG